MNPTEQPQGLSASEDMDLSGDADSSTTQQQLERFLSRRLPLTPRDPVDMVYLKLPPEAYMQRREGGIQPCMWLLPVRPWQTDCSMIRREAMNEAEMLYHRNCYLLERSWKVTAEECMSMEMRAHTGYSLALLTRLRLLAGQCETKAELGMALVMRVRQERVTSLGGEHTVGGVWYRKSDADFSERFHTEPSIRQTEVGICLEDVDEALKRLREGRKLERLWGSSVRPLKAELEKKDQKATGGIMNAKEQALSDQIAEKRRARAPEALSRAHDERSATGLLPAAQTCIRGGRWGRPQRLPRRATTPEEIISQSSSQRRIDRRISRMMRFSLRTRDRKDSGEDSAEKPHIGSGHKSVLLPSEKFDFNAMPSLNSSTDEADIALKLGKLGVNGGGRDDARPPPF